MINFPELIFFLIAFALLLVGIAALVLANLLEKLTNDLKFREEEVCRLNYELKKLQDEGESE